jgi:prepilin peptidase CpaA
MHMPMLVIAIGLLLLVAYGDARTRRIPNTLNLTIGALGAVRLVLADSPIDAALTLAAAAVVFAAGILLFWRGVIGGGDAKLVSAMILLVGHHKALDFLVLMSLSGGALALAIMARDVLSVLGGRNAAASKPRNLERRSDQESRLFPTGSPLRLPA